MTSSSDITEIGADAVDGPGHAIVRFVGEEYVVQPGQVFTIGRSGDLVVDDNPHLHRLLLSIKHDGELWWVTNVGRAIEVTIGEAGGRSYTVISPGRRVPLVFGDSVVRFSAGATSYEVELSVPTPTYISVNLPQPDTGATTTSLDISLTPDQLIFLVALCEPALRATTMGKIQLASNNEVAHRLGWAMPKFNRKLDNVCQKLAKAGVRGLHGGPDRLAANRRQVLVEVVLAAGLVRREHLSLLDHIDLNEGDPEG